MSTEKMREQFEEWYAQFFGPHFDNTKLCDEDMQAAYMQGQRDLLSTLQPALYQNSADPTKTWLAENFDMLSGVKPMKGEWIPLFKMPEVGE